MSLTTDEPKPDPHYWPKWVLASIAVASATAIANELAKVLAEALRERWKLKKPDEEKHP